MPCKVVKVGSRDLSTFFKTINKITKYNITIIFGRKNRKRRVVEQVVIVQGRKCP